MAVDLGERSLAGRARPVRAAAVALLLALGGCATATATPERSGPPPFRGLQRLVLVRPERAHARSGKDALDAVRESLEARGRSAREVELGARPRGDEAALESLYRDVEGRVAAGTAPGWSTRRVERLGRDVGPILERLDADGAVLYFRFGERPLPPAMAPPGRTYPYPGSATQALPRMIPAGAALALVDRDGNLVWFDWGGAELDRGSQAPANAAEAVDAVVRTIEGTLDGQDGA